MNTQLLNLSDKQEYAVWNILQSLANARTYCSYLDNYGLRYELEDMIERLSKRIEKKINNELGL